MVARTHLGCLRGAGRVCPTHQDRNYRRTTRSGRGDSHRKRWGTPSPWHPVHQDRNRGRTARSAREDSHRKRWGTPAGREKFGENAEISLTDRGGEVSYCRAFNAVGLSNLRRLFELETYPTVIPFCAGREDGPDGVLHSPPNPFRYVSFPRIAAAVAARKVSVAEAVSADPSSTPPTISHSRCGTPFLMKIREGRRQHDPMEDSTI